MKNGKIGVTTENIFPVIKKFLYSDHEIFLRELISNAVDATQKLKTLSSIGEAKGDLGDVTIRVAADKEKKTLTVTDRGVGMTAEEVDKYINQIAFSGAEEFMEKYKNQAIIGHFGLGFYSAFMVSDKVEIFTKSYKEGSKTVHWSCTGSPEFEMEETDEARDRGTTIVLHLSEDSLEYAEDAQVEALLKKYCRFLPVPIAFGKVKEWKDGKYVDTDKDNIINNVEPLWTRKPADITEEQYKEFYRELYPMSDEPLFSIHLNIDYPFHLTGILYFPKIHNNFEIPEEQDPALFEPGLCDGSGRGHRAGVPDAAARRDRLAGHSAQRIAQLPAKRRQREEDFELHHPQGRRPLAGVVLDHAFGLRGEVGRPENLHRVRHPHRREVRREGRRDHALEERRRQIFHRRGVSEKVKENQTDKNKTVVFLYVDDPVEKHSFLEAAKGQGVRRAGDGRPAGQPLRQLVRVEDTRTPRFVRVDSDVVDKLIQKDETLKMSLSEAPGDHASRIRKPDAQGREDPLQHLVRSRWRPTLRPW